MSVCTEVHPLKCPESPNAAGSPLQQVTTLSRGRADRLDQFWNDSITDSYPKRWSERPAGRGSVASRCEGWDGSKAPHVEATSSIGSFHAGLGHRRKIYRECGARIVRTTSAVAA